MSRSFYSVLGVAENASQEAIQDAYRERVKETHPDLNDHPDAADQFKDVVRAEEVLGDPDERSRYDRLGHGEYVRTETDYGPSTNGSSPSSTSSAEDDEDEVTWTPTEGAWDNPRDEPSSADMPYGNTSDRNRQGRSARAKRNGASVGREAGGYAVNDWEPEEVDTEPVRLSLTQERALLTVAVFVFYPIFLYYSVTPTQSLFVNVPLAVLTLLLIGYLLSIPEVGLAVFGAWSAIAPVGFAVVFEGPLFSPLGFFVLGATWVPFGYALMVAHASNLIPSPTAFG